MIPLRKTPCIGSRIQYSVNLFCLLIVAWAFGFCPHVSAQTNIPTFGITSFGVQSNVVNVAINSSTGGVYSLQALDDLQNYWVEIANKRGNGSSLNFSDLKSGSARFYRVAGLPNSKLNLYPSIPKLGSGAVSLPDAVAGTSHSIDISPVGTGSGPYALALSNPLPDGVSFTIISNNTLNALVRLAASGIDLVTGQRKQFTVAVTDNSGTNFSRVYDLRVVAPPPVILNNFIVSKANSATNIALNVNGVGPLTWSLLSGAIPGGMGFTNGVYAGTPTPDAAELNETGLYTNVIRVTDSFTDRVTGQSKPRTNIQTVTHRVRLSYRWNLFAARPNSPAFGTTCTICHSQFFWPDFSSESALSIINVNAGSGGECSFFYNYVLPGNPYDSLIVQKLMGPSCGERMPLGGPYLNDPAVNRLIRWISEITDEDED